MILGLKTLSENLETCKKVKESKAEVYTINQIDEHLVLNYNKMKSIKEQVEEVKSQWKALQEDVECFSFAKAVYQGSSIKEGFQKAIDDLKLEFEDARANYNFYKNLKNKVLTEAEIIVPPSEEYSMEDTPIYVEDTYEEIPTEDESTSQEEIKEELHSMISAGDDTEEILQYLWDELVPESGASDTVAGELVRAIMELLYQAKANKYFFFEGAGLDRCGSSAQYLKDNGYEDDFSSLYEDIYAIDMPQYKEWLMALADKIIVDIDENVELINKKNSINSRQYNYQEIIDMSPIREYSVEIPKNITELYDDIFNIYDILRYIKETLDEDGITDYVVDDIYDKKQSYILMKDIKSDTLEYLTGLFEDSKFWDDYYNDLTSELEEDLQILHNTLNESYDKPLVDIFMEYHENSKNYKNNPDGYDQVYAILDQYGSEDEDVDVLFSMATEEEQLEMIDLIRPRDEYLN